MNVTVRRIEYASGSITIGGNLYNPQAGKKLLIIHWILHNANAKPRNIDSSTINWTAVGGDGQKDSQEYTGMDDGGVIVKSLNPAQLIRLVSIVQVSDQEKVAMLLATNTADSGTDVARYNLEAE